jgi:hypothetical protein
MGVRMRVLAIGLAGVLAAVVLAGALVPGESQTARAAEAKTKTKAPRGSSGLSPDRATTMTATALAESKKKQKGLKKLPGKRTPPTVTLKRGMVK